MCESCVPYLDPDQWDWDHPLVVDRRTPSGVVIAVRFDHDEMERLLAAAGAAGEKLTTFIHDRIVAQLP